MPLTTPPLLFLLAVAAFFSPALGAETLNVYFKTSPRVELLRPFADPIDLSLLITGADGRAVDGGNVAIRLDAPAPGLFFSTDYPLVEGTLLNDMRLPLRQGKVAWKYLFPIRGEYRLAVEAVAEDGTKASKMFFFKVRENRRKWLALGAFSASLLVLGFVAGRVFTRTAGAAMLVIAAAILAASAGVSQVSRQGGAGAPGLEVEPATVGKPSVLRWRSQNAAGGAAPSSLLSLSITHLEKQKVVFAVHQVAVAGEWSMKFHFPDGAEYRVVAIAQAPGVAPVRTEQVIAVSGAEPPAKTTVPAITYFLALIALGLAAGRWSKRGTIRKRIDHQGAE